MATVKPKNIIRIIETCETKRKWLYKKTIDFEDNFNSNSDKIILKYPIIFEQTDEYTDQYNIGKHPLKSKKLPKTD